VGDHDRDLDDPSEHLGRLLLRLRAIEWQDSQHGFSHLRDRERAALTWALDRLGEIVGDDVREEAVNVAERIEQARARRRQRSNEWA
jgi:hypothetical protein